MFEKHIQLLNTLICKAIQKKTFAAIDIILFNNHKILFQKAYGNITPNVHLPKNSIFDLASLTKPFITATLTFMLYEQNELSIHDKVYKFLPLFNSDTEKQKVSIAHLLSHSSGLPDWLPLYQNERSKEQATKDLLLTSQVNKTGQKAVYSCLGYIILKLIIELIFKKPLDLVAQELIFNPLNMQNSYFRPDKTLLKKIVPTGNSKQRKNIWGEVHDDNSLLFDAIGGNAGLFANAYDVCTYSQMILNSGSYKDIQMLSHKSVSLMSTDYLDNWGLGFQIKKPNSMGNLFTKKSFGHTGFTGTSVWLDRNLNIGVAILSNRTFMSYIKNASRMKSFRAEANDILLRSLQSIIA